MYIGRTCMHEFMHVGLPVEACKATLAILSTFLSSKLSKATVAVIERSSAMRESVAKAWKAGYQSRIPSV